MTVKLEQKPATYKITVITEADVVKSLIESEYNNVKDQIAAPGFRKGHVPRDVAEKLKSFDKFSVYRNVISTCFEREIAENKVPVISYGDMSILGEFSDSTPLVIQATVTLTPKVLKFDIDDVVVEKKNVNVTDVMIEEEINQLKVSKQKLTPVESKDYVLNDGDEMLIDFVGKIDGVEFQGGSSKGFRYVIGTTKFIPGFHEQLVLLKTGDSGVVNVTFPNDYGNNLLRGKNAQFDVTVHSISSCSRPSTSDLAMEENMTEEQFREKISLEIKNDLENVTPDQLRISVLRKAIEVSSVEPIPDEMVNGELQSEWDKTITRLGMSEKEVEKKLMKKSQFFNQKRSEMEALVKTKILLLHVADNENISVSEEEMINFLTNRIKEQKRENELDKLIDDNINDPMNRRILESTIKQEKAVDWIFDHCTLTEN